MLKKNKVRVGVTLAVVAGLTCAGTWAANADPTAGTYPALAGVGSDTTQDVLNGLATQISALGSYDAVDPSTGKTSASTPPAMIQTRAGGPQFVRPFGSGAGRIALSYSYGQGAGNYNYNGVNIKGQVDFARSSGGPASGSTGSDLTYIPFAQDAVTYAVNEASDFPRNVTLGTAADPKTKFTLYNIYHCFVTQYTNADGELADIKPLIPQEGSGTRSYWLGKVGLTESTIPVCVTSLGNSVEEHNGSKLTEPGNLVPFSISQYIAQGNHSLLPSNVVERRFAAQLGSIGGFRPYVLNNGVVSPNPAFPLNRPVFNVVATNAITAGDPAYNQALVDTFVGSGSAVCQKTALIQQYGFTAVSTCGSTVVKGPFVTQ